MMIALRWPSAYRKQDSICSPACHTLHTSSIAPVGFLSKETSRIICMPQGAARTTQGATGAGMGQIACACRPQPTPMWSDVRTILLAARRWNDANICAAQMRRWRAIARPSPSIIGLTLARCVGEGVVGGLGWRTGFLPQAPCKTYHDNQTKPQTCAPPS